MDFSKLDAFMKQMPERGIPACELAVTKDGETIYRTYVGYADSAKTRPVSNEDMYWIFSATKVITCICAMKLVEEGRLKLDDPVSKYIPEYAELTVLQKDGTIVKANETMRVIHLFTMTGGMTYNLGTDNIKNAEDRTTLGIVRAMAKDPLMFEPGTRYRYSLCHDVLAAVVEVVSKMRFSEYVSQLLFNPLGLKNIGFHPTDGQLARFSAMYRYRNGTAIAEEIPIQNAYCISPDYDSGGAGLFSTVDDYTSIITAVACGKILKPETLAMMQKGNYICDDALNDFVNTRLYGYSWGLCGRVHTNPTLSLSKSPIGEFGWDGAAGAFSMIDPDNRIALYYGMNAFSCQYAYHVIHPTIRNLVYEELKKQ